MHLQNKKIWKKDKTTSTPPPSQVLFVTFHHHFPSHSRFSPYFPSVIKPREIHLHFSHHQAKCSLNMHLQHEKIRKRLNFISPTPSHKKHSLQSCYFNFNFLHIQAFNFTFPHCHCYLSYSPSLQSPSRQEQPSYSPSK